MGVRASTVTRWGARITGRELYAELRVTVSRLRDIGWDQHAGEIAAPVVDWAGAAR